tara:strand:- start:767 stop:2089 length:1323 start_codon:yes stop_codon:yes gene_type:complete
MTNYICCPQESIPKTREQGNEYISLYSSRSSVDFEVGDVALKLEEDVRRSGIQASVEAWDFCSIAMAVAAIDESALRKKTADGWTRVLKAEIQLSEPLIWQNQIPSIEQTLRFLTGDFWNISLVSGGKPPPSPQVVKKFNADCVSLLSGGVDSLAGAIDLCKSGMNPILVSKVVRGDKDIQNEIASRLGITENHVQWRFNCRSTSKKEDSTRARSLVFFAYAALVASSLSEAGPTDNKIKVYVPENGLITLNLPLTPLRIGTLSTKTTHPTYLKGLQRIWDAVGIRADLTSPFEYRFRTKGEILDGCLDKDLLVELVGKATSCGRYGVFSNSHCGRCVPCLVRRSAFLKAGLTDSTLESTYKGRTGQYVYPDIAAAAKDKTSSDIRAAGRACLQIQEYGIEKFIGGGLSFCSPEDRNNYVGVVERGLEELRVLLEEHHVL